MIARTAILEEARSWLGTPYRHQASAKQSGCDCLGLIRGVWRGLYGAEPESIPPYTPDWAEARREEALYEAARRHMKLTNAPEPGDVILFRMHPTSPAKHAAILDVEEKLIHAYWGRAVVLSRFAPWWRARAAASFAFPGAAPWPS